MKKLKLIALVGLLVLAVPRFASATCTIPPYDSGAQLVNDINTCFAQGGSGSGFPLTANVSAGGYKIQNQAAATTSGDPLIYGQSAAQLDDLTVVNQITDQGFNFANIPAGLPNGTEFYCKDCDPPTEPPSTCTSSGIKTGSFVFVVNGQNICGAVGAGGSGGGGGGTITGVTAGFGLTGGGTSGNVTLNLSTPVSIANGGTGTNAPGLIAGSNIALSGTWPTQTISATSSGSGTVNPASEGDLAYYSSSGIGTTVSGTGAPTVANLTATSSITTSQLYDTSLTAGDCVNVGSGGQLTSIPCTNGGASNISIISASGTYTTPSGATALDVLVIGGGGGGGGGYEAATAYGGGSGAPGAAYEFVITAPTTSYAVTIGTGGTAGACSTSAPTAGGAGGQSAFGDYTVNGGPGGAAATSSAPGAGGSAPSYINFGAEIAVYATRTTGTPGYSANGGGASGGGYGGGGAGGTASTSSCTVAPGAGANGIVIVTAIGTSGGGTAGGDLSGTYPNPSVVQLHFGSTAIPLNSTAPTSGQCLEYDGTDVSGTTCGSGSGSGTVDTGAAGSLAYYASNGTTVSGTTTPSVTSLTVQSTNLGNVASNETLTGSAYEGVLGGNVTLTLDDPLDNNIQTIALQQAASGGPYTPTFAAAPAGSSISWSGDGAQPAMCGTASCVSVFECRFLTNLGNVYKCTEQP